MPTLEKRLRNKLEKTVKDARDIAEAAAKASLEQLGVQESSAYAHLTDEDRSLRRALRAHARQLGNGRGPKGEQEIDRLIEEVAYEHWHRMLFARFLAENNLLMYPDPDDPVAISLEECEDLAADEGAANGWELAARYAARMLPQIFRPDSPVFRLTLPPEHQQKLERLVADLPLEVFTASDSLGWVYQFWQAKRKDEVNASEVKIGARELPAVTQLFTEPYMVSFLLDNSLGAWWAARRLTEKDQEDVSTKYTNDTKKIEEELRRRASILGVPLEYLRFVKVTGASSSGNNQPHPLPAPDWSTLSIKKGDNLPHWTCDSAVYHISLRLSDSVPASVREAWKQERDAILATAKNLGKPLPEDEEKRLQYLYSDKIENYLDAGHGACHLRNPVVAGIVADALRHFDGVRYRLHAWCVMPNHVHAIVEPVDGHQLEKIVHSWKSFTANQANKILNLKGQFWQHEAYDHIIRSEREYRFQIAYVWENPDKAGLKDWNQWRWKNVTGASSSGHPDQDGPGTFLPAASTFPAWPKHLSEFKLLDPCCGSGHFLVAAFLMLVAMRMELEGLAAQEAVDKVLSENIHGLEIDQRCVALAAFALALAAWTYPDAGGYRPLPELNLACSGLAVSATKDQWTSLAPPQTKLRNALDLLYDDFQQAPILGSLLNPSRGISANLVDMSELAPALQKTLSQEESLETHEAAIAAQGLAKAAGLLAGQYHLVVTNVPYLARGKQDETLREFSAQYYPEAKNDLATVFLERCLELTSPPGPLSMNGEGELGGTVSVVLPQNWLFLTSYRKFREKLLKNDTWHLIARLGPGAFETISGEVVKAILISLSCGNSTKESGRLFGNAGDGKLIRGVDVTDPRTATEKAAQLQTGGLKSVEQARQLENPDAAVQFVKTDQSQMLSKFASTYHGISTTDYAHFGKNFWELANLSKAWIFQQTTIRFTSNYSGKENILLWENGEGQLKTRQKTKAPVVITGLEAWGKKGIAITQMRQIPATIYIGNAFDDNTGVLIPKYERHLLPIWCFCSSEKYNQAIREIDQTLKVTYPTLVKVPFDLDHWTKVATEKYPNGLPEPYSDDPTQWIFHGHPCGSVIWDEDKKWTAHGPLRSDHTVLHVALARLLGYRWPAEKVTGASSSGHPDQDGPGTSGASDRLEPGGARMSGVTGASSSGNHHPVAIGRNSPDQDGPGTSFELADEQREWALCCEALLPFADDDGIVCIPPVRGEASAADRMLNMLTIAWETGRSILLRHHNRPEQDAPGTFKDISPAFQEWFGLCLKNADHADKTLESWLREKFFTQHCKLFHHRPFIWHIWDGLRDGFAALVNYHKLDRKNLETLIYTYLGDWISRQKQDIASGVDGAQERLAAAENLKKSLELILEGEAPYDIFVRWKPLDKQPIGWEPDLNDGVRLNIRPFLSVPDVGKRGAGVLRDKPNINWNKDRGKDVESAPWFHLFKGDRINDHHLALAEKRAARGLR